MEHEDKTREIGNAQVRALEAQDQLTDLEDQVNPIADHLTAILALLTGSCRGRVRQSPDRQQTIFDVHMPGQCAPEPFVFPTLEEIVTLVQKRQTLTDTLAEAEEVLAKHGLRLAQAVSERPTSHRRYTLTTTQKPVE